MPGASFDSAIGSEKWPGLSKLIEECGEVLQVAGKLIATGGAEDHWDGSNLRQRLVEECADVEAALSFFECENFSFEERIEIIQRMETKRELFEQWHKEGEENPDA